MPGFLKGSALIAFVVKIALLFLDAYKNSFLKRLVDGVVVCFKESGTAHILHSYVMKKPWFRYSAIYALVMLLAKIVDKFFAFLNRVFKAMIKGSVVAEDTGKAVRLSLTDKCFCAGILLISIPVGVMIGCIVFKNYTIIKLVLCWLMFFFGIFVVLLGVYGKDSLIIKALKNFIDAVK